MRIRRMTPADKPAWIRMRVALWPDCPPERHALEIDELLRSESPVFVAENSTGKVIGFAEVSLRHDHVEGTSSVPVPYLEGWYVGEAFRGRGVGRALVHAVENWALAAGFSEIASDAELTNLASIQAHQRLGFREVGRSVHFVRSIVPPPG